MYLLDTDGVSEFRRPRPHAAVVAWIERLPDEHLHVSAMTLGELQAGVEITREQDEDKALAWVDRLAETYNVIPVDGRAFRVWARLMHRRRDDLIPDALIAATAIVHDLTVATRTCATSMSSASRWSIPLRSRSLSSADACLARGTRPQAGWRRPLSSCREIVYVTAAAGVRLRLCLTIPPRRSCA
jgi:hypothetical protein